MREFSKYGFYSVFLCWVLMNASGVSAHPRRLLDPREYSDSSTIQNDVEISGEQTSLLVPGISIGMGFLLNFVSFFVFFKHKNTKNSLIARLFMIMNLMEAIALYILLLIIIDYESVASALNINNSMSNFLLRLTSNETNAGNHTSLHSMIFQGDGSSSYSSDLYHIYKLNASLYTSAFFTLILFNIFYCMEVISLYKSPFSNSKKRYKIYNLFSAACAIIVYLYYFFVAIDSAIERNLKIRAFDLPLSNRNLLVLILDEQLVLAVIYILYCAFALFSILYLVLITSYRNRDRVVFLVKHIIYVLCFAGFEIYSILQILSDDRTNILILSYLAGISGIVLGFLRQLEIFPFLSISRSNMSNIRSTIIKVNTMEFLNSIDSYRDNDKDLNRSNLQDINKTLTVNKDSKLQSNSLSELIQSNQLIEYMVYLLKGINIIANKLKTNPEMKDLK